MSLIEFRTLGSVDLRGPDGRELRSVLAGPKRVALLTHLALQLPPGFGRRDTLLGLLWPELEQDRARNSLRNLVHVLRRELGTDVLVSRGDEEIAVDPSRLWSDASAFERALQAGDRLRALELYRGDLLEGFFLSGAPEFERWLEDKRARLRQQAAKAASELAEADRAEGEVARAVDWARRAVALAPYDEDALRSLVTQLDKAGDRAGAVAAYEEFARRLSNDLDLQPTIETRTMIEQVRGRTRAVPAPSTSGMEPFTGPPARGTAREQSATLPVAPTPLIGRESELAAVKQLLGSAAVRLVTFTGAPGSGKTRLALEVAAQLVDGARDGVFLTPLTAIRDHRLVVPALARTLGVRELGTRPALEGLQERLRGRRMLLVLDNFEQVLEAGTQIAELLAACADVKLLVTSREALRLRGEREFPVPPLEVPCATDAENLDRIASSPAVALFVQRAQAVNPSFELTTANAAAVAEICRRLDGLPLAIELAAARVKLLPPQVMVRKLENRLALLTDGARDLPRRQRTLREEIGWSFDLLNPQERQLFRHLAVFAGACALEAVEAVHGSGGAALDGLSSLVNKSLVLQSEPEDGEVRFSMLETIREFARDSLEASGQADEVRGRHADHYAALTEAAEPGLTASDQASWLNRLDRDHDNLRAVLAWALDTGRVRIAARICAAIWRFWWLRGHLDEGREWLDRAMAPGGLSERERVRLLNAAGGLAFNQGDFGRSVELFEEALALARPAGRPRETSRLLRNLGLGLHECGDRARAVALLEEALALSRRSGDKRGLALTLESLAITTFYEGDYERAKPLYEESLDLYRELGDRHSQAIALTNLGNLARQQGELERAAVFLEEGRQLLRALESRNTLEAALLSNIGDVARDSGHHARARTRYKEALAVAGELGLRRQISITISGLAELTLMENRLDDAARLYAIVAGLRESSTYTMTPEEERTFNAHLIEAQSRLGEEAFASIKTNANSMSLEQVVSFALEPPVAAPF